MPIEELLKRYAGYGSDGQVSDGASASTSRKSLRSSSTHKGCICHIFTCCLLCD